MGETLTLYTHPMSRGRIARWMLEEVGEPYETEQLVYGESMKAPAYLAVNPLGKVPAIVHGTRVVTEGAAICAYLADAFPAAGLAPAPADRADYYRWMFFSAGPLESALMNRGLGFEVPEDKRGTVGYGEIGTLLDMLEEVLARQPFMAGESFSAADVSAGSQIGFGLRFGTIEARAAFEDYWARVTDRDGYRRATAIDDAALQAAG